MEKVVNVQEIVKELAEVLATHKIPMSSLETVLENLKDEVYSNTVVLSNN